MVHSSFLQNVKEIVSHSNAFLGLGVGGSWISGEIDQYSDLDLVLVTLNKINDDREKMIAIADEFGNLLQAFTGEHVGEPRVLICLYDKPLLHVDIKFIQLNELEERVEDPVIIWERENSLSDVINRTCSHWPEFDYQWIEDRFWIWLHYAALKIGRGEYFEACEFLSFLRTTVIAPLLQIKNGYLPRGVRKVEANFTDEDLELLQMIYPDYNVDSIVSAYDRVVSIYLEFSETIFPDTVTYKEGVRKKSREYLEKIRSELEL